MTMTTPRNFRAHVALTAQVEAPPMWSGAYGSVGEFVAVALAAEGASVVCSDLRREAREATAAPARC